MAVECCLQCITQVMLDAQGYLKLIDFGIAKKLPEGESKTFTMRLGPCQHSKVACPVPVGASSGSGEGTYHESSRGYASV